MKRNRVVQGLAAIALIASGSLLQAEEEKSDIATAVTGGKASIGIRYRYEFVDQDTFPENANASTARLRLNYRTGLWKSWSAFGEFDHVFHVLLTDFNSGGGTTPDKNGVYPVVADPKGSDLNQLYADYTMDENWKFRFGRQRINLDNQRFVGGVGWRQNEQTYDALTLNTNAISNTALSYSYVAHVRRIFGQKVAAGEAKVDGHLLNAKVTLSNDWSVVPYFYFLDYDAASNAANSTATLGARLAGSIKAGEGRIALIAELATQSDAGNNPASYDAQYWHFDATWTLVNGLSLGLAYESLGSDSGVGFRTPLATLHKFQGWADVFVPPGTAPDGINDLFATVKYKLGDWNLTGVYHDFSADTGGADYGTEFDFAVGRSLGKRYGVLFKGAFFSTDAPASYDDTTKFWVMLTANY